MFKFESLLRLVFVGIREGFKWNFCGWKVFIFFLEGVFVLVILCFFLNCRLCLIGSKVIIFYIKRKELVYGWYDF